MSSNLAKLAAATGAILALAACQSKAKSAMDSPAPLPTPAAGQAFLAKMATAPDIHRLPSGLEYKVVQSGPKDGVAPHLGDEVKVNYEGTLIDGTVFDSSYTRGEPASFTLGEVIPGWNEALQLMRPGDVWYLYVPAELAYGDRGGGDTIPPGSALVFKVELLGVLPKGSRAQG
jgi:peptidylprolyl isomerase/FKBP-type peptidyl-prolyl cis-trans isomerase FklB